ncbi:MAG: hypothetical protein ACXWQO_15530 [Bdellovibrionota bacterium]
MKFVSFVGALALTAGWLAQSTACAGYTIGDYNSSLPVWGTSWLAGNNAIGGYYPSFYTGFAPRVNTPSRIHIRLARGNNTRMSLILDEQTISDYLFDLAKKYQVFQTMTNKSGGTAIVNTNIDNKSASFLPQLANFNKILESDSYGILPFVARAKTGATTREEIYSKGLETLTALNPGRMYSIRLNLTNEFRKWKSQMRATLGTQDAATYFAKSPSQTVIAIDSLVWGRVNYVAKPSAEVMTKLATLAEMAKLDGNEDEFVLNALALFKVVTGDKYQIRHLAGGRWEDAIQCSSAASCQLIYSEFTTIYPTGTVVERVRDQFGNSISGFGTTGLFQFLSRSYAEFDNIREEAYYGWIPKMDYEGIGNGFHNPGVRNGLSKSLRAALNVPSSHDTLWAVMRGGVSHGCSRLASGHAWEMRNILPNENKVATKVNAFLQDPRDFDVYDIDGDGKPEVMGVKYSISYGTQAASGLANREGKDLDIAERGKAKFYTSLYGATNVFTIDANGTYQFTNPGVSVPSYLDYLKRGMKTRMVVNGTIPLYEQDYERDKIQLYMPSVTEGLEEMNNSNSALSKRIVRLMGRIRGCSPYANKETCGEAAFDREAAQIIQQAR